jgi:hypothetical protein
MKSIEKKLDSLWIKAVREIWNNRCGMCATRDGCECHHIRIRKYRNTRWDTKNGILLCKEHHILVHAHPSFLEKWLDKRYWSGYYSQLKRLSLEVFDQDYEKWEKYLRGESQ